MSVITAVQLQQSDAQVRRARRELLVFFAFLVPLSTIWYVLDDTRILNDHYTLLMLTPAIASIFARLVLRAGLRDISFQFGGQRGWAAIALVVLFPLVLGLLTYVPFWLLGWAQFYPKGLPFATISAQPVLALLLNLLIMTFVGTLVVMPYGLGEELGWRGFMLTRMISAKIPWPIFISGLIWGVWHLPIIVAGLYDATSNPWLGFLIALVSITGYVYIISWARLYSGSVWPAALAHAAWNVVYNDTFGLATKGGTFLLGETGIVSALALVVTAVLLYRFWPLRQPLLNPQQSMESSIPERQVPPGYLVVGLLLILAGVLSLLMTDYFMVSASIFGGLGFLVYALGRDRTWQKRARWQQVLLIVLLAVLILSLLGKIGMTLYLSLSL